MEWAVKAHTGITEWRRQNVNKVPHCSECELCKCKSEIFTIYYCTHLDCVGDDKVSVDKLPKTSSKWCPKRKGKCAE